MLLHLAQAALESLQMFWWIEYFTNSIAFECQNSFWILIVLKKISIVLSFRLMLS